MNEEKKDGTGIEEEEEEVTNDLLFSHCDVDLLVMFRRFLTVWRPIVFISSWKRSIQLLLSLISTLQRKQMIRLKSKAFSIKVYRQPSLKVKVD